MSIDEVCEHNVVEYLGMQETKEYPILLANCIGCKTTTTIDRDYTMVIVGKNRLFYKLDDYEEYDKVRGYV